MRVFDVRERRGEKGRAEGDSWPLRQVRFLFPWKVVCTGLFAF